MNGLSHIHHAHYHSLNDTRLELDHHSCHVHIVVLLEIQHPNHIELYDHPVSFVINI